MSNITRLTKDDLPRLLALEKECFHTPWDRTRLGLGLNLGLFTTYGLHIDQELAAYLSVTVSGHEMQILKLAVCLKHRRQGLATRLLNFAEFISKKLQIKRITLEVNACNESALHLYKKMGYQVIQKKNDYYPEKNSTALILAKDTAPTHTSPNPA